MLVTRRQNTTERNSSVIIEKDEGIKEHLCHDTSKNVKRFCTHGKLTHLGQRAYLHLKGDFNPQKRGRKSLFSYQKVFT